MLPNPGVAPDVMLSRQLDGAGAASQAEVRQLQQSVAQAQAAARSAEAERDAALAEQEVRTWQHPSDVDSWNTKGTVTAVLVCDLFSLQVSPNMVHRAFAGPEGAHPGAGQPGLSRASHRSIPRRPIGSRCSIAAAAGRHRFRIRHTRR